MKKMFTFMILTFFTVSLIAVDAEARRMGGGKSFGKQRQSLNQQSTPNQQQSPTPAQSPATPAGGGSKWGGALAGLAAGGLLAALFMGGAFEGINMADIIMLILIAGVVFFIIRMLRRPRTAESTQRMQYSGMNTSSQDSSVTPPWGAARSSSSVDSDQAQANRPNIPPGFQVEPFLRNAKMSFIRLQAANDTGDLNDIREYTTPEMFAEISMQTQERGGVTQKTEVMFIDAKLLDVEANDDSAIASVRFTGQMRELPDGDPEDFDEVWHVEKNLRESGAAWLLAGIQQVADTDLTD
ncbi:Tim44 domain-containing protein [Nitrosomonas marina]|uniref:Predicted lipid-binding transport protein, Tim44 family n=1 Tax=Nitrosomonas marina TaxID=917 RepID=A0A1H8AQI5_9PROT|nr:TIM44-like domain-containing protein [Nitrosomonas marina]SEM72985.1 Predicted lipid-binding transport protein, Tim44 family [Nitrosomonas marina]